MPEVFHNQQTKGRFVPETPVPSNPRASLDLPEDNTRKRKLEQDPNNLAFFKMERGTVDSQNAEGEEVENNLMAELKVVFETGELVVLHGAVFRQPNTPPGSVAEKDFVIILKNHKLVIGIECKQSMTSSSARSSVVQLQGLQALLEQYFGAQLTSGEWWFAGMMYYQKNALPKKTTLCPVCEPFTIHDVSEVQAKMTALLQELALQRPHYTPSHPEYQQLVQGLAFSVLAQPLATHATMVDHLWQKVEGGPGKPGRPDKIGQGDFLSVIFWSLHQADWVLRRHQFVLFSNAWGVGKTLVKMEVARREAGRGGWVYFVVIREDGIPDKTLLELELEFQFRGLANIKVVGLACDADSTLAALSHQIQTFPGSYLVDELVMPEVAEHQRWGSQVQSLRTHMAAQPGAPLLWITVAGIDDGVSGVKQEHFGAPHLSPLLPGFLLPSLSVPLRNTREVIRGAGLDTASPKQLYVTNMESNVSFTLPPRMLEGVPVREFLVSDITNQTEVEEAVRKAREEMAGRMGDRGVAVLSDTITPLAWIVSGLVTARGAGCPPPLVYTSTGQTQAGEGEVSTWLEDSRRGRQRGDLLTDNYYSRGWESPGVLVVSLGGLTGYWENLAMRSVAYCCVVRRR